MEERDGDKWRRRGWGALYESPRSGPHHRFDPNKTITRNLSNLHLEYRWHKANPIPMDHMPTLYALQSSIFSSCSFVVSASKINVLIPHIHLLNLLKFQSAEMECCLYIYIF